MPPGVPALFARAAALAPLELELRAEAPSVQCLRKEAGAFAAELGMSEGGVGDVELAVAEAAGNALHQGCAEGAPASLRLQMETADGRLIVRLAYDGVGVARVRSLPREGERSFGLSLIAALTDAFELRSRTGGGTEAVMWFGLQ